MNERMLREKLRKGDIADQYLLIANEPILIDNTVRAIKSALKLNEAFDFETLSAVDTPVEEIIPRLYLSAFGSTRRLTLVSNLEELNSKALKNFSQAINNISSHNCLIMTYRLKSDTRKRSHSLKTIEKSFSKAKVVHFHTDTTLVHKWILSKNKKDKLGLSVDMMRYLEAEFSNDITGLKNEFDKIDNYLYEANKMNTNDVKDLAKGVCAFNKYQIANTFLKGSVDVLELFEEIRPYLRSYAEIVDALTRSLVYYTQRTKGAQTGIKTMTRLTDDIIEIDRQIKTSSFFAYLMLELFFRKNTNIFRKGAIYGG